MLTKEQIKNVGKHNKYHREELESSKELGCYFCLEIYSSEKLKSFSWTDGNATYICHLCGIDSVIGDKSGYELAKENLQQLRKHWFE